MVKSVLGKLIQREFGKERYACYADKLKRKQSMDVFCDIYEKLSHSSEEELDLADRKSTRLNSSHITRSRMPSSA